MIALGLRALPALDPAAARDLRARTIFDLGKLDPQCGDTNVICPFPLALDADTWSALRTDAESLAADLLDIERELIARPELHAHLGIPFRFRRLLRKVRSSAAPHAPWPRVIRFDFHPTTDGAWAISEANTDVPGGFLESSGLPALFRPHHPEYALTGDPTAAVCDALAARTPPDAAIGLIHATAYTDDRQVMHWLARHLAARNRRAILLAPDQLAFTNSRLHAVTTANTLPLDALFRFFPAEWLTNLPRSTPLAHLLFDTSIPHLNPACALLTQSKRWPLYLDQLAALAPTWRRLLPETREPSASLRASPEWILKPALGRVGDGVTISGLTPDRELRRARRAATCFPRHWLCQRRFNALAIDTPDGPRYPCLGIYTIGGRASGIYGRLAARPLIDSRAQDVAVLVGPPHSAPPRSALPPGTSHVHVSPAASAAPVHPISGHRHAGSPSLV